MASSSKKSAKSFQNDWLEITEYKGWLQKDRQLSHAYCTACQKSFLCGKSELEKHHAGLKHQQNIKLIKTNRSLDDLLKEPLFSKKVKAAELKLAAFFAEHNVALSILDHLVPLLKNIFDDSKIANELTLGRTKCTACYRKT